MLYVTNHILVPTIMPPCCVSIVIVSLLMSEERDDSMIGSYPLYRICGSLKCLLLHSNPRFIAFHSHHLSILVITLSVAWLR